VAGVDEGVEQVRTEVAFTTVAESVTVAGFGVQVGPVGETDALRLTAPENPLTPVILRIVEESNDPAGIVSEV